MTKNELEGYRTQLRTLAKRFDSQVSSMREEALGATEIVNADGNTDWSLNEAEEERALAVLQTEQGLLREVTSALQRLDDGTFGRCEQCGLHIPKARLNALPYARHCVDCALQTTPTY